MEQPNPWRRQDAKRILSLRGVLLVVVGVAIGVIGLFFAAGDLVLSWGLEAPTFR
ncbi:hypothetical protein OPKNFCMD_3029 [Methylobacterium crusticola]|uniref:Uncharacterized protein n=1 Tax=Methylobacterium crusticola TaxID=1697972 RepID=A0ABQ4R004_9HYPH|nr:hypothetical protein [Methylobacterium crusticola]GJD50290.1 hypothetical protein OPKNFCMD_3029 [Methylobacterium crusticola]